MHPGQSAGARGGDGADVRSGLKVLQHEGAGLSARRSHACAREHMSMRQGTGMCMRAEWAHQGGKAQGQGKGWETCRPGTAPKPHLIPKDVSPVVDKDPAHPPAGHQPALGQAPTGQDGHTGAERRDGLILPIRKHLEQEDASGAGHGGGRAAAPGAGAGPVLRTSHNYTFRHKALQHCSVQGRARGTTSSSRTLQAWDRAAAPGRGLEYGLALPGSPLPASTTTAPGPGTHHVTVDLIGQDGDALP